MEDVRPVRQGCSTAHPPPPPAPCRRCPSSTAAVKSQWWTTAAAGRASRRVRRRLGRGVGSMLDCMFVCVRAVVFVPVSCFYPHARPPACLALGPSNDSLGECNAEALLPPPPPPRPHQRLAGPLPRQRAAPLVGPAPTSGACAAAPCARCSVHAAAARATPTVNPEPRTVIRHPCHMSQVQGPLGVRQRRRQRRRAARERARGGALGVVPAAMLRAFLTPGSSWPHTPSQQKVCLG